LDIELLKRKLKREKISRKQAEKILEDKALELYHTNEALKKLNESLEEKITQRISELQESETKYRNVIEQATDIIYSTNADGYITFVNARGVEAFGYTEKELLGRYFIDFVLDKYKEDVKAFAGQLISNVVFIEYSEFPIVDKNGNIHWLGQNVNRVEKPNGEYYFIAVARDITLRKSAEKKLETARLALEQSEVKYRSVLENMDLGLMEVDTKGVIVRVYEGFSKMTGYSKEELIGKDAIKTLIVKGYEDILIKQDSNRLNGELGVYEVQIKRKDNTRIWVLISGAPFYDNQGVVIGSLGIHYDISDIKNLEFNLEIAREKAVESQKAEQKFLANMSHEIRTPLNGIIGMAHLLMDSGLDEKQQEYVKILSDSSVILKGLVADILDISKLDSGMAEISESVFHLGELANSLINSFKLRANEEGVELICLFNCDLDCFVKSDKQWLNQILINLLGNAIKFTNEGRIELNIKRVKEHDDGYTYSFEVIDTGVGIEPEELGVIFSAFKQANTKVRKDYGGTGLGLSIASRLIALLGGELEVDSSLGKGSRFFFSLRFKTSSKELSKNTIINEINIEARKDMKLLIVEDNYMNQRYISSLLDKWQIEYDLAENGRVAVEKYKQNHYNLIFMDLSMPIMDGYEATLIIRGFCKEKIPIVALTASNLLSKKELALKSGMTDFLAKPFVPEDLFLMLTKHLDTEFVKSAFNDDAFTYNNKLDFESLKNIYGNDYSHALDMFTTFIDVVDGEILNLKTFIKEESRANVKRVAHKIKPIFSMVGLGHISKICEKIEQSAKSMSFLDINKYYEELMIKLNLSKPLIVSEIYKLKKFIKGVVR